MYKVIERRRGVETQLEQIRKEEMDLLENGQRTAERFVAWYRERREAAARKQRICSQNGHVIVESAVQEQQLNYLRANLAELNRRILAVMEKSEKGFPASVQAQKTNGSISQDEQIQWLKRTNRSLNQQLAERIKELEEMRRPKEIRPVSIHRPSAFVRPACQYFAPTQPVDSPTPVKAYDTLM
ncbi:hypothetical protein WR25_09271 [Diploscapter pachys]|uniref:Uncharacterized protein n=1 Tax=Diploscapter pachys TaxID=2018661 RepID=A0A2A2KVQ6_9BILA|nr:hypothetical protein WR25_09271 [Diploscapter pachys]